MMRAPPTSGAEALSVHEKSTGYLSLHRRRSTAKEVLGGGGFRATKFDEAEQSDDYVDPKLRLPTSEMPLYGATARLLVIPAPSSADLSQEARKRERHGKR